jgi:hypothetical protein
VFERPPTAPSFLRRVVGARTAGTEGGAAINKECHVEDVKHPGVVDPHLARDDPDAATGQPWILGDPEFGVLDVTTRLGF